MKLKERIICKVQSLHIDAFTVNDILELSSYDNLRKTLERMVKDNSIRRLIRGVYDIPKFNNTFGMFNPPSLDGIAKAIARNNNWNIYPTGNYALNILGLSTQVPLKHIYISSGPYRTYEYEGIVIEFKRASLKETNSYSYNTNLVIQAFKEIGKDNISDNVIKHISSKFSDEELDIICNEAQNTIVWIYEKIIKLRRNSG